MSNTLRLLVVEDVETDFLLLTREMRKAGYDLQTELVCTAKGLRDALARQEWDIITTDHKMPDLSAPEVLSIVRSVNPDIPIIVVSGEIDLPLAVSLLKSGANDYIQKSQLALLPPAVEHELANFAQRIERANAEAAMHTSEAILEAFLESSESLMGVVELRGDDAVFVFCNDAAARMLGKTQDEMRGLSVRQIGLPNSAIDVWVRQLKDNSGQSVSLKFDFEAEMGARTAWFQISANPIAAGVHDRPWFGFSAVDITRLKEAEKALRESETRYRGIVEDQTDLICRFLPDRTLTFVNEVYCSYFGRTRDELIGESFLAFVAEQDAEMVNDRLAWITPENPIVQYDHRVITPDGGIRWLSWIDRGVYDEQARLIAFQSVGHDITDRKRVEDSLRKADGLWQSTFDAIPYPICILGADFTIQKANSAMGELAGQSPEDCVGRTCYELMHFTQGPVAGCPHAKLIADGAEHIEEFFEPKLEKWLRVSCSPITDEDRQTVASVHIARDISGRVEVHKRLSDLRDLAVALAECDNLEEALRMVLDVATHRGQIDSGGIYLVDETTGDLSLAAHAGISDGFAARVAYFTADSPHAQWAKRDASSFYPVGARELPQHTVPEQEGLRAMAVVPIRHAGNCIALLNLASHTCDDFPEDTRSFVEMLSAQIGGVILRTKADQQEHQLNRELDCRVAERTAELDEANRELESFSYSVSHDLRAPLRGIKGFADAIWEDYGDNLDPEAKDYLSRIRKNTDKMAQLIEDILSLSRVSRVRISAKEVNLSSIAQRLSEQLQRTDPDRQVEWVIPKGICAYGDEALLEVALSKLLDNSWKFTGKHPTARIEFGVEESPDGKVFFVRDDGAGFDMAYADRLFGVFQRLHTDNDFEGTGVGLAITKRVVDRHGGKIWAESSFENGATLRFTIPGNLTLSP